MWLCIRDDVQHSRQQGKAARCVLRHLPPGHSAGACTWLNCKCVAVTRLTDSVYCLINLIKLDSWLPYWGPGHQGADRPEDHRAHGGPVQHPPLPGLLPEKFPAGDAARGDDSGAHVATPSIGCCCDIEVRCGSSNYLMRWRSIKSCTYCCAEHRRGPVCDCTRPAIQVPSHLHIRAEGILDPGGSWQGDG